MTTGLISYCCTSSYCSSSGSTSDRSGGLHTNLLAARTLDVNLVAGSLDLNVCGGIVAPATAAGNIGAPATAMLYSDRYGSLAPALTS